MTVGENVQKALDHWSVQEWAPAMWHACEALDETARKRYPNLGAATRFKWTVRDGMDIFTAMTAPDIDFANSRYPVEVQTDETDARPDMADLLYAVNRYLHDESDAIRGGCEITPHAMGVPTFNISDGHLELRASAALGLLGIAVFAPENRGEEIPGTYQLTWQQFIFHICGWWGWQDHFREIISLSPIAAFPLDFGPEWDSWKPVGSR